VKYFQGKVPHATGSEITEQFILNQAGKVSSAIEAYRFREALGEIMNIARYGNQILSENEPWKLIKTDIQQTGKILYDCMQIIANLGILLQPFLPDTADSIFNMLQLNKNNLTWSDIGRQNLVPAGQCIANPILLFQKIEDEAIEKQIAKLSTSTPSMARPQKNEIQYDDFAKLDLRIGRIISAEKVAKTDKLLKLTVDLGYEHRTIVSGIAGQFKPEDIVGKQVTVVANLAPRKIKGIESKGMILMAEDNRGNLQFINPDTDFEIGARVS
jgi:methionyl-tRNA synthetase